MLDIGAMLGGRYEILKRIGVGGMADVYMAKDHKLNRKVAVKVLKKEYVDDEKFIKKFQTEAQAIASLIHPNIVNIYDVGAEDGINYIVMELAEGITLKEYIRRKGYLSAKETVDISIQIASAIAHAHKNHIIHRDIKPQNILISETGNIKVTDFGIAKAANSNTVTSTATAIGSVHYISPEQAKGRFCDEKSDIYSLGITMYEMVTGQVPFDHENGVTIALMHLQNEITPPSELIENIPNSLEKIILKCTMKKPEERYQTAEELIQDLKLVFEDTSGDYVGVVPMIDDSPTIMMDQDELKNQIDNHTAADDENAYLDPDDDEDEGMNSKLEKLVIVLAAVVGAIILVSIIVFVIKSSGVFKSGDEPSSATLEVTTTAEKTESEKYTVPNVVGMSLSRAEEEIGDNLKITTKEEQSSRYEAGQVISQSIEGDTEVEKGRVIILTVSSGENKASVPDVTGETQSTATKTLKNLGFNVLVESEYSSTVSEGYVISQSPSGGVKLSKSSTVTIVVSKGSNQVQVPDLRYYTQSEAKQQLQRMGLKLGSVSKEYNSEVEKGQVIRQSITKGRKVSKGTAVGIVISLGERPQTTETEEMQDTEE